MKTTHNRKGCQCPKGSDISFCLGEPTKKEYPSISKEVQEVINKLKEKI
jgi:hypothetical protein